MQKWYEPWEIVAAVFCAIAAVVVVVVEYQCACLTSRYPLFYSGILGLASGVFGTVVVFWFGRAHRIQELRSRYLPLAGAYRRTDIRQDNTLEKNLAGIRENNLNLPVRLQYLGGNAFRIEADYWKNTGCKVEAHIEFVESNKMVATGRYRYLEGSEYAGHFGTYVVYRFQEDHNKLLVLYQHVFPRNPDFNPDANRGSEIWVK
jgi:hypothetical protein